MNEQYQIFKRSVQKRKMGRNDTIQAEPRLLGAESEIEESADKGVSGIR